jgi:DNA-directed RNA polymerase beta' subunit
MLARSLSRRLDLQESGGSSLLGTQELSAVPCTDVRKFAKEIGVTVSSQRESDTIVASEPYRKMVNAYEQSVRDLPAMVLEEISWTLPKQTEIAPTDEKGRSNLILITKKSLAHKSGPQAEGTLFDPRMGGTGSSSMKGSGNSTAGLRQGRILFPQGVKIPYYNFIDNIIVILSCMCLECNELILNREALIDMKVLSLPAKHRLAKVYEASKDRPCMRHKKSGGGLCLSRKSYDTKSSKETGYIVYTEMSVKCQSRLSGYQVDSHFRNLALNPESIKFLGYDDVEEMCAFLAVGIIVKPTIYRPYKEFSLKIKNKDNDALVKIIDANEKLKLEIERQQHQKLLMRGPGDTTTLINPRELESSKMGLVSASEKASNQYSRETAHYEAIIREVEQQYLAMPVDESTMISEEAINQQIANLTYNVNYLMSLPNAADSYETVREVTRINGEIQQLVQKRDFIAEREKIRRTIVELRAKISEIRNASESTSLVYQKQINEISQKQASNTALASLGTSNSNLISLITELYKAHKEYIETELNKVKGKNTELRRNGLGKHAGLVGRGVASPGVDIEIGEIEIPGYLTSLLGVIETITGLNIAEMTILLENGKISYIRRKGVDSEVTEAKVQTGQLRLMIGDKVVRHLRNGDVVVAVRMPTIHRGNMLAFHARIVPSALSIRVHMIWTTSYNLDFDGDEFSLYMPQEDAIKEVLSTMYAPLNLISPRSVKPIGGVVYNTLSAWYLATKTERIVSQQTWEMVYLRLTGRSQLPSFYERLHDRGVRLRTGHALFSMLLPEDFNYPTSGEQPIKNVIIESGILISGTLDSEHLAPAGERTIVQAIYYRYDLSTVESFLNDIYTAAYIIQAEQTQTITARDCAYGEEIIAKLATSKEYKTARDKVNKLVRDRILDVDEYRHLLINEADVSEALATDYAQDMLIEKRIQKLGTIPYRGLNEYDKIRNEVEEKYGSGMRTPEDVPKVAEYVRVITPLIPDDLGKVSRFAIRLREEKVKYMEKYQHYSEDVKVQLGITSSAMPSKEDPLEKYKRAYIEIVKDVKNLGDEAARELVEDFMIGEASKIEGTSKLKVAERKISLLGPVPKDKIRRKAYENQIVNIINEMGNVGVDAAHEVRKFVQNNLLDMASDFGAGTKGSSSNIASMGGYIGSQQIQGQARLLPAITDNTRCVTSIRPGDRSLQASGYLSDNYFQGMSPLSSFFAAVGQREGMSDIATKTASAGHFNRVVCKAMENLVVVNGSVRSQNGKLYQYNYGEDNLAAERLIYVGGKPTFVDIAALADQINYEAGWELLTEETQDIEYIKEKYVKSRDSPAEEEEDVMNFFMESAIQFPYTYNDDEEIDGISRTDLAFRGGVNTMREPWFAETLVEKEYELIVKELKAATQNRLLTLDDYVETLKRIRHIDPVKALAYSERYYRDQLKNYEIIREEVLEITRGERKSYDDYANIIRTITGFREPAAIADYASRISVA